MKVTVSWKDCGVDTVNGYKIKVTQEYSSFDETEIEQLKEQLNAVVPGMVVVSPDDRK